MKSFAERLVARGAGRPMGLPILTARPAARFEREMAAPVETERPAETPAKATPAKAPASRKTKPAIGKTEIAAEPAASHPLGQEGLAAAERPMPPPSRSAGASAPVAPPVAPATLSEPAPQDLTTEPVSERITYEEALIDREEYLPRKPFFSSAEPKISSAIRTTREIERAAVTPSISIGRIEVQFLPEERPVAPQRAEPQRTRGFDAYARARRGQPR